MMAGGNKGRKKGLEAAAAAFLSGVGSPGAPQRLREYGLQRVLARAESEERRRSAATSRHAYRNPALLRHALVVTVVVVLVMMISMTGAYAFSLDAQPGSPLYGTKIFFERARLAFNFSSASDMRLEIDFSERRMEELQRMAASGKAAGSERWLREYGRNIEGAGLLFEALSGEEAERLAAQFQEVLDRHAQMMHEMRRGQPSELYIPIDGAYRICDQERARMRQRCGQHGPGEPGQEAGGRGQGNCPGMDDPASEEETSQAGAGPAGGGAASREPSPSTEDTLETISDTTNGPSAEADNAGNAYAGEGGKADAGMGYGDTGYGGSVTRQGHTP